MVAVEELVSWAKAFALTELVEAPIYRFSIPTTYRYALAASAITHPFVWFFFPWVGDRLGLGWTATSALSEMFAWLVEAFFFRLVAAVSWRRAALASLVANGASVAIGLAVRVTTGLV